MADKTLPITGGCLCGAVRFEATEPPTWVAHCHCRSCRLSRGVAFVTWTSVPMDRFSYTQGEQSVAWYRSSESILWGFCKNCGSSMFYQADKAGHSESPRMNVMYVSVGSLVDAIDQMPKAHVSYEEKVSWNEGSHLLPKYRGKMKELINE